MICISVVSMGMRIIGFRKNKSSTKEQTSDCILHLFPIILPPNMVLPCRKTKGTNGYTKYAQIFVFPQSIKRNKMKFCMNAN